MNNLAPLCTGVQLPAPGFLYHRLSLLNDSDVYPAGLCTRGLNEINHREPYLLNRPSLSGFFIPEENNRDLQQLKYPVPEIRPGAHFF